ncbi:MAG: hypothetical protein ACUZ8H_06790 [Candidatus Anammoxibacter sp.]
MLNFKDGVPLGGLQPDILYAIDKCKDVFDEYKYDCTITSTTDGKHMTNSLHYVGFAIDLRTRHIQKRHLEQMTHDLKDILGRDYDVILESNHWHIEMDKR